MMRYYHSRNGDWTGCDQPTSSVDKPLYMITEHTDGLWGEVYFGPDAKLYRCVSGQWEVLIDVEWDGEWTNDEV